MISDDLAIRFVEAFERLASAVEKMEQKQVWPRRCPNCYGKGSRRSRGEKQDAHRITHLPEECTVCQGTGRLPPEKE